MEENKDKNKDKNKDNKNNKMRIIKLILTIIVLTLLCLILLSGCNRQLIDTVETYDKAIIYIGDEKIEIDIKKWKDYDGEQIQVIAKDGKVYLFSMNNAILIKEK